MMIMVKREEKVCIKLTNLDQGKFTPEAIASYPGFARSYPALCVGQDDTENMMRNTLTIRGSQCSAMEK